MPLGAFDVLVVEDNVALAENVAELLADEGATVRIASDGATARVRMAEKPFDLAIVDVRLTDVSGIDLVPALKASSPDGEVILVTGNATLDTAIAAVRQGVFAYVQKPFAPVDLLRLAERALGQVRLRKERSELEVRAAEAEAMAAMGRLTTALAHEIRNPLNGAMLNLELIERSATRHSDPAVQKGIGERVRVIKQDLGRLSRLLDDYLGLARPQHLAAARVALAPMIEDLRALQEPVVAAARVALAVDVEDGVPDVRADEGRLKQVVLNLMVNALDAMQPQGGGELTIRARRAGTDQVEILVEDTGPGLPPEIAKDAFRPFVTNKPHGTGLGLSIVKKMVELHGGTVVLEPRTGGGTSARVVLPAFYGA